MAALLVMVHARVHADRTPREPVLLHAEILSEAPRTPPRPVLAPPQIVQIVVPPLEIPVAIIPEAQAVAARTEPAPVAAPSVSPAPAPSVVRDSAPVMLDVDQVDYVRRPSPHYPRAARQARLQGTVLVWVLIDADGRPREVRVERSSGYEQLDREGCDAVSHALFKPYRENGAARSAQAIVPVEFSLDIRTASRD
ncbi:MAG TPA: TonB family protein [Steroidobacteraceae bacterium]|nr:TonB family protein [Steroidobacteraceae bacterium]